MACQRRYAHIEYDPNRTARIALPTFRRRREALHPGAKRVSARATGSSRAARGHQARQQLAAAQHPSRATIHAVELRPAAARSFRDRPASASSCSVARERAPTYALPSGEIHRVDVQYGPPSVRSVTPTSQTSTGARPAGCAGRASGPVSVAFAMNPAGPPHGGGKGKTSGWPPPGEPEGQARGSYASQGSPERPPDRA